MKLEFLALKWAMTEKFREYLLGRNCVVYNDPLSHLSTANLEQHWVAQLSSFDFFFAVNYRPDHTNGNADALSRQSQLSQLLMASIEALLPGTPLPDSVLQTKAKPYQQVTQAVVSVFPSHSSADLAALQGDDSTISVSEILAQRSRARPTGVGGFGYTGVGNVITVEKAGGERWSSLP